MPTGIEKRFIQVSGTDPRELEPRPTGQEMHKVIEAYILKQPEHVVRESEYFYYDCLSDPGGGQSIVIGRRFNSLDFQQLAMIENPATDLADKLFNLYNSGKMDEFKLLCEDNIPPENWFTHF